MRIILAFIMGFVITFVPANIILASTGNKESEQKVIEATSTPVPTDSPTPSPTPTLKPTLKPTPEPTETPTPVPVVTYSSQQINELIERFAGQYAVDPNIMRHIALCESGFNPLAKNGPYWGLYQFGEITWRGYRVKMGENPDANLRIDAEEAIQTASYAYSLGNGKIWPNCQP